MKLTNKKLFRFFPFGLAFILMMNIIGCNRSKKTDETGTGADTGEPGKQYLIKYQSGADEYFGRAPKSTKGVAGETVTLRKNTFLNFGYTFIGWSDGKNTYLPGESLVMPEGGATLTALWKEGGTYFLLDNCDSNDGWWGTFDIFHKTDNPMEGTGYNGTHGTEVLIFCKIFDSPLDISAFKTRGFIRLWLWVEDAALLNTSLATDGVIELNDGNGNTHSWSVAVRNLKTGWNDIHIPFDDTVVAEANLTDIRSFRLYQYVTAETEIYMDCMEMWMPDVSVTVPFLGGGADYLLGRNESLEMYNIVAGTELTLPDNLYVKHGYDFAGWSDGKNTYSEGAKYTVPEGAVSFTAVWGESEKKLLTYDYGTKKVNYNAYLGELITVPSDAVREGYVFAGWQDGDKVYRPGTTYTMKDKATTLTANWVKIDDFGLLSDAVGAWELREGGTAGLAPSAIGGNTLASKWAVWLNSATFGQVADFSVQDSCLYTENSGISLSDKFTVSAWIKAPKRESVDRVILAQSGKPGSVTGFSETVFNADSNRGWWGATDIRTVTGGAAEGNGYLESTADDVVIFCCTLPDIDLTKYAAKGTADGGTITVRIYVKDVSKLQIGKGVVEFSSDGGQGAASTGWTLPRLKEGWNEITFPLSAVSYNNADLSKVNYFRFYHYVTGETTLGIDALTLSASVQGENSGGWMMYLDGKTGQLAFSAKGLKDIRVSGVRLNDDKWHHVAVTRNGSKLTYYVDSKAVKTVTVSGKMEQTGNDLYVGGTAEGGNSFDGSIAQVRIYNTAKTPDQITSTVIDSSDNEQKRPRLNTRRGVLVDRFVGYSGDRQYQEVYVGKDYLKIDITNIQAAKKFGMDHIKITVPPNSLIDEDGHLISENMRYVTNDVNLILAEGMPVIFCLHPEPPFKSIYLNDLDNFELLCNWYQEFAAYIGENWTPDEVSIQLMTEPYDNSPRVSWTWMSDRMYISVRNELPDHTIITSSDSAGNLEYLKKMSPVTDSNVIYSFTTYEPYIIGFNTARTGMGGYVSYDNYLRNVPYPVPEGLTDKQIGEMAKDICALVPQNLYSQAMDVVKAYLSGKYDSDPFYRNNYNLKYTEGWNMSRMNSLHDWSEKYGGNIHMMCVEFGCMDSVTAKKLFGAAEGSGISAATRIRLIKDLRTAFEANDIGWSYWLFNGVFTIFDPDNRVKDAVTDDSYIKRAYDPALIEDALGLTPDYSWTK